MTTTTLQLPPLPDLMTSLAGEVCPACGQWKRFNISFCQACRRVLTDDQRLALYSIDVAYEAAMHVAMVVLNATEFKTVKVKS